MVVDEALAEPDDAVCAKVTRQPLLDIFLAKTRIAVGVEQTLFGGQEQARPVAIDRAAFQNPVGLRVGQCRDRSEPLANAVIAGQVIFAAPAVESKALGARVAPLPTRIAPVSRSQMSPNGSTIICAKGASRRASMAAASSAATSQTCSPAPSAWTAAAKAATSACAGARSSSHKSAALGNPIHTAWCAAHSGSGGEVMGMRL
jgi:hypothetical protein